MRSVTALVALTLVGGCAKNIKPEGPVVTPYEHARDFSAMKYSGAKYIGAPLSTAPVLPFMAFGATYDLDIVVGLKDDNWDMIELIKMQRPDQAQPMWAILETRAGSGEQALIANVTDINTWMPELPLFRKSGGLEVEDRTTADGIDITVRYDNYDNQPVELVLQGAPPDKLNKKRNGNTMGHSANDLLAVLDMSSAESLFNADIRIDEKKVRARKVAAILPLQFAITQSQGGLARGEYRQVLTEAVSTEGREEFQAARMWEPPPPPPPPPVIPAPINLPDGEEIVLMPLEKWEPIKPKDAEKALAAQETKLDVCLVAATIADPAYKGLVMADFHVKQGKPWQITIDEQSSGTEIVWSCVQETIAGWTFDEKLDGGLHVTLGKFPYGYEGQNDLEKAWLEKNPVAAPAEVKDEKKPEAKDEKKPAGEDLPEEGEDLLDGAETVEAPKKIVEAGMLMAFDTIHKMADNTNVEQPWTVVRDGGRVWVTQDSGFRRVTYEFLVFGEANELRSVRVENWGQTNPSFTMTFSPAMPDLARPFSGRVESKFVMDVGGQLGHATGTVVSESADQGAKVTIKPSAPNWAASQPMVSQVTIKDGQAEVLVRMAQ